MTADLVVAAMFIEGLDAEVAWERGDMGRVDVLCLADGTRGVYVAIDRGVAFVPRHVLEPLASETAETIRRAVAAANRVASK